MAKDKQVEIAYKAEGVSRTIVRKAKRRAQRAVKKERNKRLNGCPCCGHNSYYDDW